MRRALATPTAMRADVREGARRRWTPLNPQGEGLPRSTFSPSSAASAAPASEARTGVQPGDKEMRAVAKRMRAAFPTHFGNPPYTWELRPDPPSTWDPSGFVTAALFHHARHGARMA